jgi:hypothetical protein
MRPGLTPTEFSDMSNLAKNVLGIQQAAVQPDLGTLTVRAPASSLKALNKTLADLLDGKSDVLLDVKIYEVANTRTRLVGVQPPQRGLFSTAGTRSLDQVQLRLDGNAESHSAD